MVEFLRKFENRGIKIARVNSIIITNFINLELITLILYGVGVRCDQKRFSVLKKTIFRDFPCLIMYTCKNILNVLWNIPYLTKHIWFD